MTVFVIIEHDGRKVKPVNYNVLSAAFQLKLPIETIVIGSHCASVAEAVATLQSISKVHLLTNEIYEHFLSERCCEALLSLVKTASHILAPATSFGKNLLPRIAAKLDVGQVSEVMDIVDQHTFKRPIYAGNAIATVKVLTNKPICITVRTTAFPPMFDKKRETAQIIISDFVSQNQQSQFVKAETHQNDRPILSDADIVISGGRGLQNKEAFDRLVQIADRLGAAIGASRAAVDSGLAPNECQVGQTGQVVAPALYFAVGISGAIQHLAGMKDSKIIVAINKDPEAPIFQIATYGLVADLTDVLPEWEAALMEMGY